jgi:hypothetical protein
MINEILRRYFYSKLIELAQQVTGFRPHYKAQYGLYLQGPRWFILRNLRLWWDGYRCTSRRTTPCAGPLQAHHVSYDHKGQDLSLSAIWKVGIIRYIQGMVREFLDLRILCDKHHDEEHGIR